MSSIEYYESKRAQCEQDLHDIEASLAYIDQLPDSPGKPVMIALLERSRTYREHDLRINIETIEYMMDTHGSDLPF